jgi:hypothetical protein
MLLVTTASGEVGELDVLPDQACVPTTRWIEPSVSPSAFFFVSAVAAGEQRQPHAGRSASGAMVVVRHARSWSAPSGGLLACLDADQHGEEGDNGLAAADIAPSRL